MNFVLKYIITYLRYEEERIFLHGKNDFAEISKFS